MSMELLNLSMETKTIFHHLTKAIVALSCAAKAAPVYIELQTKEGHALVKASDISVVTVDEYKDVTVVLNSGNVSVVKGMTYDAVCEKLLEATGGRK